MNAILGLSQLARKLADKTSCARPGATAQIHSSAGALHRSSTTFSTCQKLEARRMELEQVPFRSACRDRSAGTFARTEKVKERGLRFDHHFASGTRAFWSVISFGCRKFLTNLLSNAIKFTERGSVSLRSPMATEHTGQGTHRCTCALS